MASKKPRKLKADNFIGANRIVSLKEDDFGSFINDKDVALVMFYNPKGAHSQMSRTHFVKATKTSTRENAAFAAVNCEDDRRLCVLENIQTLPTFKVYSHGRLVSDQGPINDYRKLVQVLNDAPILPPKPVDHWESQSVMKEAAEWNNSFHLLLF